MNSEKANVLRRLVKNSKVDYETGCFLWNNTNSNSYGQSSYKKRGITASRLSAYVFHNLDLNSDMQAAHKRHCFNKNCWSPNHIYVATRSENAQDSVALKTNKESKKTHCPKGHEYTVENTYVMVGKRIYRICKKESDRLYRLKKRSREN